MSKVDSTRTLIWQRAITVVSFAATWMMARKLLENWLYWVVGDAVSVYLNWKLGYDGYAILNVIYIILSLAGLVKWWRKMGSVA